MNDWLNIKGKTVLVTGASSGIGKAIVEELLELGVNVANFDLSDNDLRHPNLLFVKVDVTSRSEVEEGVAKIVERFGNIDAVVNNAGINVPRLLIDAENPRVKGKALTGDLKGLWRYRVGDYRILADIQDDKIVILILDIGHRSKIYL